MLSGVATGGPNRPRTRERLLLSMPDWINQLKKVQVRHPIDGTEITVAPNPRLMQQLAGTRQIAKLFDYSYVLCGLPPQVNNIGYFERNSTIEDEHENRGLLRAHAIFRGLKRPCIDDGVDAEVYVYVMKPRFTYRYAPGMVCAAKRTDAPRDSVFVTYIRFIGQEFDRGEIVGWDWVPCDAQEQRLPAGYNERYSGEVWRDG